MLNVKTVHNVSFRGERVFVRVDFNVPLDAKGNIGDDTRIVSALPTIKHLCEQGARVILASHLGRPNGKRVPSQSLKPVAKLLSEKLGKPVAFAEDCVGEVAKKAVEHLEDGDILLLENLRFHPGEEKNDPTFAKQLAELAEGYVNNAFGTAHRAHASTVGITKYLSPCVAGLLMEREMEYLGKKTAVPGRPFTVIFGGAKVSDKLKVIDAFLDKADAVLIGGAMAYTFALALGKTIGNSLVEPDKVSLVKNALKKAEEKGVTFSLPSDTVITNKLDFKTASVGEVKIVEGDIPEGWEGVDIGPKTRGEFAKQIAKSKTILWNGPMGVFEIPECAAGTVAIAQALSESSATTIVGGGDSAKAVKDSGYADQVTFMSTGGGASLEFLEGRELPGIAALSRLH